MNIAIPVYGDRVMPRFGCAREITIVSVEDTDFALKKRIALSPEDVLSLPNILQAEQVSLVICGGIHSRFQQLLAKQHIRVLWGTVGDWQDVMRAYLDGTLQTTRCGCEHRGDGQGHRVRQGQGGKCYAEI